MVCIDFLIWIGKTKVYKTVNDYVKEAEKKGCSRKISHIPPWAIPGISRAFLAHKGGHKRIDRASLFGYFVIHRIEIITASHGPNPTSPHIERTPWSTEYYEKFREAVEHCRQSSNQSSCIRGSFTKSLKKRFPEDVRKGKITFKKKPPSAPGDDDFEKLCKEIFEEIIKKCWEEFWESLYDEETDTKDLELISDELSSTAGGLGCSRRTKAGAIYLVNALMSEINDAYSKRLYDWLQYVGPHEYKGASRAELIEILKKSENKTIYPEPGIFLFKEAHAEVLEARKTKTAIPSVIEGKAKLYGELIVFNRPYPVFQRRPTASFRNYIRIDGDQLLAQIGKGIKIPTIPYCIDFDPDRPITKAQLSNYYANKFGLQKSIMNKFLNEMANLAVAELKKQKPFILPEFGKLKISQRKSDGKNIIRFRPNKKIIKRVQ